MTDAEWNAWLADERNARCVLVDFEHRSAGGATVKDYISTHPFITAPSDTPANTAYRAVVRSIPQISQRMADVLYGRSTMSGGNIVVDNGDGALDSWITANFAGRACTMYLGSPQWPKSDFRAVWTGVLANLSVSDLNSIALEIRARDHLLSQDIVTTKIVGGESDGKYKPLVYGWAYNVPCPCTNAASNVYIANAADVYAFDAVRVNGVATTAPSSPYSYTDNNDGTLSLNTTANGQVTVDVRGMFSGGTLFEKVKEIVKDLCVTRGPFVEADFEATSWAALNTTFPQPMGLHVPGPMKYFELLDLICSGIGAFWTVTRDGKILIGKFQLSGASTLSIGTEQIPAKRINIVKVYQPLDNLRRGYARQWAVQTLAGDKYDLNTTTSGGYVTAAWLSVNPWHSNADRELYANGYKWVTATNAGAANLLKTRDPPEVGTLLKTKTDAQNEADRWMGIWGSVRVQYAVECFLDGARVNLGDRVTLTHPRYGLAAGVVGTVVAIGDQPTKRRQMLEVLV